MASHGSDECAIIESGTYNCKLDVIMLTDWFEWEWKDFSVLMDENDDIKWFDEEQEAIDFVFDNFDKSVISEALLGKKKTPNGYHFG